MFGYSIDELKELGAYWTAVEIFQQPGTWKKTVAQVKSELNQLKAFIDQVVTNDDFDIIFTGAGTSEFVGNALFSGLSKYYNYKIKSYASTELVVAPELYISKDKPTLLISFGRSGNSPESVGAVEAANVVGKNVYHLFITCNHEGQLSKFAEGNSRCYALNLTPETHDQSFAMTSSFSNMYLAALLCLRLDDIDNIAADFASVIKAAEQFLNNDYFLLVNKIKEFNFERIIYLGSNVLKGIAQEAALKMCELSGGKVMINFDTPLGFRHGPKSMVSDDSLTVLMLSDDPFMRRYEMDLLKEMSRERKNNQLMVITSGYQIADLGLENLTNLVINFNIDSVHNNLLLGLCYIVVAQLFAMIKSMNLNIMPDTPCPSGEVNRVVKGVTIYPYGGNE